jgi:PAS domain S-box-containing protein
LTEELLRRAVEASGEVIFMTDVSGTITYVNPEFVRVYGWEPSEVVGVTTPRILKGGSVASEEYAGFWHQLLGNNVVRREFANRTKSGALVYVESSANPIFISGELVGFVAVQRDVTARKATEAALRESERQLQQAQKMEAIGRLSSGIAHDFNNLLTAIIGFSDLVLDQVRDNPGLTADVREIRKAGERASQLTRQLLAFSRRQPVMPTVLSLNTIIADLHKMLVRLLGEDIRIDIAAAPDLAAVRVDPSQVEQVVMNLAVNARDAMPQGGTLRIATANHELDGGFMRTHEGAMPGRYVALTMADTGCGMSKDVLAHAFEPFFTTKPLGKGTGLGLASVYGIVKQSNGYVTIDSAPGTGTTVMIYLPVVDDLVDEPSAASAPNVWSGHETILIVEDEVGLRQLMQRTLESYGYRVISADSSLEAAVIAERHAGTIDLLLSDVIMPGLSGPDLAQRVVALRPSIKVLYVSGFANHTTFDNHVLSSRACLLPKPFAPQALAAKVRECLQGVRLTVGALGNPLRAGE